MATSGGTPPITKTKREFTPEQKRLFAMLGVAGLLAIGVGAIYVPGMLSGSTTTVPVAPPATEAGLGATPGVIATSASPSDASIASRRDYGTASSTGAGTPLSAPPIQGALLAEYRSDPFAPFLVNSPIPTPLPPPVPVPPPIFIPPIAPGEGFTGVPGADGGFGGGTTSLPGTSPGQPLAPLQLPPVNIPRANIATQGPRDTFPPPRQTGGSGSNGGALEPQPSYNKRLSGYLLSERTGVRALLEITTGDAITTAVVRPGDEVNGIRVLSIQNVSVGGTTVVRMQVREANGQQSYVDLKPSSQAADTTGAGADGSGGRGGRGSVDPRG